MRTRARRIDAKTAIAQFALPAVNVELSNRGPGDAAGRRLVAR
jgi:hypothetical protein